MAGELKHGGGGHLLHKADGHLIHTCGAPCTACDGAQPSITVTTTEDSTASCEIDGEYEFDYFSDENGYCEWGWKDGAGDTAFWVVYCKATETYCAYITITDAPLDAIYGAAANDCGCIAAHTDITAQGVGCSNGVLTGSFTLAGDSGPPDCTAYTATVTFGSP